MATRKIFGKNKEVDKKKDKKEHKPCLDCQIKIADANERVADVEDKLLRSAAEFENYKKRQQRETALYKKVVVQSILLDFLPVIDDINRAINTAYPEQREGLEMMRDQLISRLGKHGIVPIKDLDMFDPNIHEAVAARTEPYVYDNSVVEVVEQGFMLDGFLLKPAKVVVSRGGLKHEEDS